MMVSYLARGGMPAHPHEGIMFLKYIDFIFAPFRAVNNKILGIKNIKLGPTLPAFITPNVLNFLVENFNIAPIGTAEGDLKQILG